MKPVSFQGDVSALALSDVLQNLAGNQKSGTLTLNGDGVVRHIQFRDGKITSYTDNQGFSMAQWLADKDIVPPDKLEEALRRYRKAKRKTLGVILKDLRLMSEEDYRSYLTDLVLETLYEVLSFRDGTFEFHEGELDEDLADREVTGLGLEIPAQNVLMEAARRMDDWQAIRLHIPSENEIYHAAPADRERLLAEAEDEVTQDAVRLMDGTRTVRQVIARMPYSRFDACRAVAQLVAEKKVRLLDSSGVMQHGRSGRDPQQEIACLKTILEREPNNRDILERLAGLHEQHGERDEGVTFRKRLAISLLEEGALDDAEEHLRKALALNPKDITTWQRLWEVVRRQDVPERIAAFGGEYADHFKNLGLTEVARDHLSELIRLFPENLKFKLDLADVRFTLGEQRACIQGLFEVARDLLGHRRFDDAEKVFARILKYDRNNQKAKEYYEKIRSGRLARRRAFRRRLVRAALLLLLLAALGVFLGYDFTARSELSRLTRAMVSGSLLEEQRYDDALRLIRTVRKEYPYSLTAVWDARLLERSLERKRKGSTPPPASAE